MNAEEKKKKEKKITSRQKSLPRTTKRSWKNPFSRKVKLVEVAVAVAVAVGDSLVKAGTC